MRAGEPSGPIQVIPPGLLGLLQIKSPAGQNPNVLNADVQPGIDMLPFWLRANRIVWGKTSGITLPAAVVQAFIAFSPNSITVPQSEWWYVHSYTLGIVMSAGATATQTQLAVRWNSSGTIKFQTLKSNNEAALRSIVAADGQVLATAEGFWMPPGSSLGFFVSNVLVNDMNTSVIGVDYTILPI